MWRLDAVVAGQRPLAFYLFPGSGGRDTVWVMGSAHDCDLRVQLETVPLYAADVRCTRNWDGVDFGAPPTNLVLTWRTHDMLALSDEAFVTETVVDHDMRVQRGHVTYCFSYQRFVVFSRDYPALSSFERLVYSLGMRDHIDARTSLSRDVHMMFVPHAAPSDALEAVACSYLGIAHTSTAFLDEMARACRGVVAVDDMPRPVSHGAYDVDDARTLAAARQTFVDRRCLPPLPRACRDGLTLTGDTRVVVFVDETTLFSTRLAQLLRDLGMTVVPYKTWRAATKHYYALLDDDVACAAAMTATGIDAARVDALRSIAYVDVHVVTPSPDDPTQPDSTRRRVDKLLAATRHGHWAQLDEATLLSRIVAHENL